MQRFARPGSIITFHDSVKSFDKLLFALPRSIEWLMAQGYEFKVFEKMDPHKQKSDSNLT